MAEEVGQDYFNDLISRSFFQLSSSDDVDSYTMHDLINDLASFVSGEFCFRWEGSDSPSSLSKARHFSYISEYHGSDNVELFEALQQPNCLCTFLSSKSHMWSIIEGRCDILPKSHCLRVLKLHKYAIEELPDSINNLKHLKYLDLSYSYIKKLPDTICTLYNLQVLLLSHCMFLTELPANLGRLINLSHLDNRSTGIKKMPPQMGKLKDLQMLEEFVLDKHTAGDNLAELKKLEKLRGRLCISGLLHSNGLEAYILRDKKFLKELVLDWAQRYWRMRDWTGRDSSEEGNNTVEETEEVETEKEETEKVETEELKEHVWEWEHRAGGWQRRHVSEKGNNTVEEIEVLEKLQPHLELKRLTIEGYGGKMFPSWSEYYSSSALVSLRLVDCENCISLPPLGQLLSLTELHISGLNGWQEWSDVGGDNNEVGVFPNLEKLTVLSCSNLTGRLASGSLPSLDSLTVWNCPEFECFPEDGFPSKLKSLDIKCCKKVNAKSMQNLNKGLRTLTSLEELSLEFDCDENVYWFAEEEEEGLFPSTLTSIQICRLNCETIGAKWFGHLNSLQALTIWNCPALQCLPDNGLPSSLQKLNIFCCPALQCLPETGLPSSLSYLGIAYCPLLKKRCQRETGEDWPKIAHIKDHVTIM